MATASSNFRRTKLLTRPASCTAQISWGHELKVNVATAAKRGKAPMGTEVIGDQQSESNVVLIRRKAAWLWLHPISDAGSC